MIRILLVLVILVVGMLGVGYVYGGNIVKNGVVTYGPDALKVPVELESVSFNPFTGKGNVTGFGLGNPETFGDGNMIKVGAIDFDARLETLISDHVIIDSLVIDAPYIEGRLKETETNLQRFTSNLPTAPTTASGTGSTPDTAAADQITMTIKRLEFRDPRVRVTAEGLVEADETVSLESFTLTDLGTDEQGMAPSEIARHVMDALGPQVAKVLGSKALEGKLEDLKGKALQEAEKALGDKLNGEAGTLFNSLKKKKKDGRN